MPPPGGHREKGWTHHRCRWRWGISVCRSNKDLQILWWWPEPGSFSSPDSGRWEPAGPQMTGSLTEKRRQGNIPDQVRGKSPLYQYSYVEKKGTYFIHSPPPEKNKKIIKKMGTQNNLNEWNILTKYLDSWMCQQQRHTKIINVNWLYPWELVKSILTLKI